MEYFLYHFQVFLLIFTRMFALFAISPFFASPLIPLSLRSMIAFFCTIVLFPIISQLNIGIPNNIYTYILIMGSEVMVGILIGFIASAFFAVFQMAGEYFSMLIGLNISEILDPLTQIEVPIIGQFQTLIATAVFLSIFGDHMLIQAVSESYKVIPVLDLSNLTTVSILTKHLALLSGKMFMLSLKLAFPIMGTLTVLMISLALLSKSAPQMNIFMVGFPMQLTVGFLALIALAPSFGYAVSNIVRMMRSEIMIVISALKV